MRSLRLDLLTLQRLMRWDPVRKLLGMVLLCKLRRQYNIQYSDRCIYSKWTQGCFFVYMCQSFWNSHSIHPWEAIRGKSVLAKFCDSVLQKSAKIRTLQADLRKNYPANDMAQKSKSYIFSLCILTETCPRYCQVSLPSILASPQLHSGLALPWIAI